jgi:hypothetical protein
VRDDDWVRLSLLKASQTKSSMTERTRDKNREDYPERVRVLFMTHGRAKRKNSHHLIYLRSISLTSISFRLFMPFLPPNPPPNLRGLQLRTVLREREREKERERERERQREWQGGRKRERKSNREEEREREWQGGRGRKRGSIRNIINYIRGKEKQRVAVYVEETDSEERERETASAREREGVMYLPLSTSTSIRLPSTLRLSAWGTNTDKKIVV